MTWMSKGGWSQGRNQEGVGEVIDILLSLGNVHIVELLRGEEPLGIQLVGYTNEERYVM